MFECCNSPEMAEKYPKIAIRTKSAFESALVPNYLHRNLVVVVKHHVNSNCDCVILSLLSAQKCAVALSNATDVCGSYSNSNAPQLNLMSNIVAPI